MKNIKNQILEKESIPMFIVDYYVTPCPVRYKEYKPAYFDVYYITPCTI